MEQRVQFCTASDGVRIAYARVGEGPAFVWVPGWVSHLELDWAYEESRTQIENWAQHRTVIRYDKRGTGLSDRRMGDYSIEARVRDLEAVVDHLGLDTFALRGISEGGPLAIAYAARHPARVSHLVLLGTYARVDAKADSVDALSRLIEAEWGLASLTMVNMFYPGVTADEAQRHAMEQRESATPADAAAMIRAVPDIDVSDLLPDVASPTIVVHGIHDVIAPYDRGRDLASRIPNARLVSFDGAHPTIENVAAHQREIDGPIREFLGVPPLIEPAASPAGRLLGQASSAGAFRTVLFTDIVGHTEMMQRLGDTKGRDVLREHERITRDLLKKHGGAEVKTMGDGFMASFGSVTSAMDCAIALQRAFAAHTDGTATHATRTDRSSDLCSLPEPLNVRVGLNAGEPIEEDGDLFGATVILASRIAAKAGAGEILVPDTVRGLLSGKNFLFSDRGEFVPKGFDDAVRLYEVRWRES